MSFGEAAAVVAAVTGVATVSLLVVWLVSVTRALTSLQHHVEELRREPRPSVRQVSPSAERVTAEVVDPPPQPRGTEVRAGAPRLVAVALSDPVIKAAAFASGTARAVRSFRRT
jgi:hypothetical protein